MDIHQDSGKNEVLGLRERQKQDKLLRIKQSARQVFLSKGYDGATTREIANLAEVSHATIFTYAKDKRDLLFLVFNDDIDKVVETAYRAIRSSRPLLDQLIQWFTPFYRYFSQEPELGLLGLHERSQVAASDPISPQIVSVRQRAEFVLRTVKSIIEAGIQNGEVGPQVDIGAAARVIIAIYLYEIEWWLRGGAVPDLNEGITSLRAGLQVVIDGLNARTR